MIRSSNHMLFNLINEKLRNWQTEKKTLNVGINSSIHHDKKQSSRGVL